MARIKIGSIVQDDSGRRWMVISVDTDQDQYGVVPADVDVTWCDGDDITLVP